jgi:outer membrane protein insertion porin family
VGVGSNNGIVGDVTYRKDNFDPYDLPEGFDDLLDAFTGGGDTLILSVAPGTAVFAGSGHLRQSARVGFDLLLPRRSVQVLLPARGVARRAHGLRTTLGHRFGDDLTLFGGLRNEVVEARDIETTAPQIVYDFEGEQLIASLFLDAKLTRTDDPLDPTDGYILSANGESAGLWGDVAFNKFEGEGELYFRLGQDAMERYHLLSLRAAAGWMKESGDSTDVPVYERFFVGGSGSLRGFEFRGVGPHENGEPVGGKAYWTAAVEYGFPLVGVPTPGEPSLRGVAFVDAGSLASDWSDSEITDARVAVGAGIRIVVPFLGPRPVAIDFGIPVLKADGDETRLVSFSFGSNF